MTKIKHFNPMALRERYSVGGYTNDKSSFWMGDDFGRRTSIFDDEDSVVKPKVDTIQLAAYRRSIANFVNIVTGRSDIPVVFNVGNDSYTDGNKVVISSNIKDKNFDSVVGLALHEGSHIKLSDFDFLKHMKHQIPTELIAVAQTKGYSEYDVFGHVKNLLNYVEDRRIDYYIFTTSPGYKGYYHAMYKTYFHSNVIDKAVMSNEYTNRTWDSYLFRILNFTNKSRRLDVLPQLSEMYDMIFKKYHPKTITTTEQAFAVALKLYQKILNNLDDSVTEKEEDNWGDEREVQKPASPESEMGGGDGNNLDIPELSEAQQKSLERAFDKQKEFNDGKTKKSKMAKKYAQEINNVEKAGMTLEEVDVPGEMYDYNKGEYVPMKQKTNVIMVKKITSALVESNLIGCVGNRYSRYEEYNMEYINQGIILGNLLGKKLAIRNDERDTKWSRKDSGRIDKRLIAELGFGNNNVFSTTFTERYADAHLHISIDASGSMSGDKWTESMKCATAICKAASMIDGLDVVVDIRSTKGDSPVVVICYDSRVDKFSHIRKFWKHLGPAGTTPEGLCFDAISNYLVDSNRNKESYFLNISDGMPMFSNQDINYHGSTAIEHTKKKVNDIKKRGIRMMSYFVTGSYDSDRTSRDFKHMYGSSAKSIGMGNVREIAKTMNNLFLKK